MNKPSLSNKAQFILFLVPIFISLWLLPQVTNVIAFYYSEEAIFRSLNFGLINNIGYFALLVIYWFFVYFLQQYYKFTSKQLLNLVLATALSAAFAFTAEFFYLFLGYKITAFRTGLTNWQGLQLISKGVVARAAEFIPLFAAIIFTVLLRKYFKEKQFQESQATSGKFGSADWASKSDLQSIGAYRSDNGAIAGMDDDGKLIYLPFSNKLTISPPSGGKTSCSSIPILLSHTGPAFVLDVKGELWATTARYRSEVLGHKIITIDPYAETKNSDFTDGKSPELRKEFRFNPFDFISDDESIRDRMINAFASSFIINDDGSNARHFDENAKILIRGYIDYMMKAVSKEERNLAMLYELLSENHEQAEETFGAMGRLRGRAQAASNQISRVGGNERGSILSTSYRQIDWMSDSNMQYALSTSDFDLRDFLQGNMDIYVVLPQDQVREHGRLVRMLIVLLMGIIIQAKPSELPTNKILFLLDELAQLGYCPDVEQCIEVLRARGVVVWSVFQSLDQIEVFKKPDLFKGASLKQIFTLDDVKTMQWIQALGGKKTVINKTLSNNKSDSRKKTQAFGGNISESISESVQEIGADLIQINEIREMLADEQLLFLHGQKPIRCRKARYFEHPFFAGKFDINPVEVRQC